VALFVFTLNSKDVWDLTNTKYIFVFFSDFKYRVFNAWKWSVRPKHVAHIDRTNTFVVTEGNMYVSF